MHPSPILRPFVAAVLVLLIAGTMPASTPVLAGLGTIQPGDVVTTSIGQCTLNFVYDGVGSQAGRVYLGTAAHCVSGVGAAASTNGYTDFGTVAFVGHPSIYERDYAFIEVRTDLHDVVAAAVRGHPTMPTGATTSSETGLADVVRFSGYGLGFGFSGVTREQRVGLLWADNPSTYIVEGPIIFGDSGGPIMHDATGKALGIVSHIVAGCCAGPGAWNTGPTIEGTLADAAAHGFTVKLRTV